MSRQQGHARVSTGPKPPTASPSVAATRRSAGTLPGIARTASTLRQKTPGPLPPHLRNTSAPRVPSPLGPGPGVASRPTSHIVPVRTSKTTEKHVLLPEDPQLAPLPRSPSESGLYRVRSPSAWASASAPGQSERSEAEKMTKRERNDAGFSRLVAYDTAEGYRLKLLQAFLRREHGVSTVRVFDDCVYAVYNLPLLPGYGATNRVRSSPAVKSPGGVSMLERMTMAEEHGYDDEYFPVEADEPVTGADPSEYILSRSPPSPLSEARLSLEGSGPIELPAAPEATYDAAVRPPRMRRHSSTHRQQVAEAVFFNYGVSVFFGFAPGDEASVMEDIRNAGVWQVPSAEDDWEVEEFHYEYDPEAESPRIYNDMFTFKSRSHLFKLSLAHAIAQSTKLSVYEARLQNSLEMTSSFPKELATTGHLNLDRVEALQMTGRLFKLRMDVNLIGGVLDTPEIFWTDASLYPLYEAINQYLEIEPRVQVLNDRLAVVGDLLDIIHDYIAQRANRRITWVIILLIAVAIVVGVSEVVARLVFHAMRRQREAVALASLAGTQYLGINQ